MHTSKGTKGLYVTDVLHYGNQVLTVLSSIPNILTLLIICMTVPAILIIKVTILIITLILANPCNHSADVQDFEGTKFWQFT